MKAGVSWSSAGFRPDRRRGGRHQHAARDVELKHKYRVQSLVGHEEETPFGIEWIVVRVRARLLGWMRPGRARQLDEIASWRKRTIPVDWQDRHRSRRVVRYHKEPVTRIDREMNRVRPASLLPVQLCQAAARHVDGKRGYVAQVGMHRVEKATAMVDGQK